MFCGHNLHSITIQFYIFIRLRQTGDWFGIYNIRCQLNTCRPLNNTDDSDEIFRYLRCFFILVEFLQAMNLIYSLLLMFYCKKNTKLFFNSFRFSSLFHFIIFISDHCLISYISYYTEIQLQFKKILLFYQNMENTQNDMREFFHPNQCILQLSKRLHFSRKLFFIRNGSHSICYSFLKSFLYKNVVFQEIKTIIKSNSINTKCNEIVF